MVTVYIQSSQLFARPNVVAELGLQQVRLGGPRDGVAYVFPVQKQQFEQVQAQAQAQGVRPPGFFDYVAGGFGAGVGVAAGEAAFAGVAGFFNED